VLNNLELLHTNFIYSSRKTDQLNNQDSNCSEVSVRGEVRAVCVCVVVVVGETMFY